MGPRRRGVSGLNPLNKLIPHIDRSTFSTSFAMAAVTLPNISYFPSERQAKSFWETIPRSFPAITRVPLGFPEKLKSPLAWKASDIKAHLSDYVIKLSPEDVAHVETALFSFKGTNNVVVVIA